MREKVLTICNDLLQLLQTSICKKDFETKMFELDSLVYPLFKDCKETKPLLFKYTEEERLQNILNKKQLVEGNPKAILPESIKYAYQKMQQFLKTYHLGFLKDFYINNSGIFKVEISCLIVKQNSFHNKDISSKLQFDVEMEHLKSLGVELGKDSHSDNVILATENSIHAIQNLLKDFGAKLIEFKLREDYKSNVISIDKISFSIQPNDILSIDCELPQVSFHSSSEELNPDELKYIEHEIKEFWSSFDGFLTIETMKDTCANLCKSCIYHICDTLQISTTIANEYEKKVEKTREMNLQIKKEEEELGKLLNGEEIKKLIQNVYQKLNNFGMQNFHFMSYNFEFSQNSLKVLFRLYKEKYYFDDINDIISEDDLKSLLKTNNGSLEDGDLMILGNEDNIAILKKKIEQIGGQITNIPIKYHWSYPYPYIEEFEVVFDNLMNL